MTFILHADPQRSDAWHLARLGRLTGSVAGDMLASIKSGEAAARRDLRLRLVVERLTGVSQDNTFVNADMQRGTDLEPAAFAAYEALTGEMPQTVGFLSHPELMAGASPDGYLGDFDGILELKCPRSATHLKYLRAGTVPREHLPQLLHNLWISGAHYCEFLSFDPRFPAPLQTFYVRVPRDERQIAEYEQKALTFLSECDVELEAVRRLMEG